MKTNKILSLIFLSCIATGTGFAADVAASSSSDASLSLTPQAVKKFIKLVNSSKQLSFDYPTADALHKDLKKYYSAEEIRHMLTHYPRLLKKLVREELLRKVSNEQEDALDPQISPSIDENMAAPFVVPVEKEKSIADQEENGLNMVGDDLDSEADSQPILPEPEPEPEPEPKKPTKKSGGKRKAPGIDLKNIIPEEEKRRNQKIAEPCIGCDTSQDDSSVSIEASEEEIRKKEKKLSRELKKLRG